jgi:hypothetical protein
MTVRTATAAPAASAAALVTPWRGLADGVRCEHRELFHQPFGPAIRAFDSHGVLRAQKDFAVPLAFLAMKLVNRHARKIANGSSNLKGTSLPPDAIPLGRVVTLPIGVSEGAN